MQNSDSNPLTDRKTLIAIVVAIVFMIGWQKYLNQRYPQPIKNSDPGVALGGANPATPPTTPPAEVTKKSAVKTEQLLSFESPKVRFTISNRGMGIKEYVVKDYKDSEGQDIRLGFAPTASLFEIRKTGDTQPLDFDLKETSPGHYEGDAQDTDGKFHRELVYNPENGAFESTLTITGATAQVSKGISFLLPETIQSTKSASWFMPSYNHQDFFVSHAGKTETINFNHAKENLHREYPEVALISVGTQYFTSALLDRSDVIPDVTFSADLAHQSALADLSYKPLQTGAPITLKQTFYAGPKSMDVLKKIDPAIAGVIDFGYLAFIARPLLAIMKWFFGIFGNWGVAIIALTLSVRFVVLPFNLMSVRSMRAMQKIQPQINELRARHKDDPMTMNKETMALMKENKANPLGGCLPMLIQIPVFFALYRVIGSSVELYQSPFALWIHDLSAHDPIYILPVLMGITMFFQQKLTPTAMDPAQAKIMQFLPIVFTTFMLQVPSGLTLYMVVSALFGIIQQYYVLKGATPAVAPVKIVSGGKKK